MSDPCASVRASKTSRGSWKSRCREDAVSQAALAKSTVSFYRPLLSYDLGGCSVRFSSVQTPDRLGHRGDKTDDSAEILFNPLGGCSVRFSSVQTPDRLGHRGDKTDDSAEILFKSFLQEATVSYSGIGRDVHSLMLSIQHFLYRPQHRPISKVP